MRVTENQQYLEAVKANLAKAPDEVNQILYDRFKDWNCFLWGGDVRQPIYHAIYDGSDWKTDDWDILVDDSKITGPLNLEAFFEQELRDSACRLNRFGTIKWVPYAGLEIDVSRFSNANMIRNGETTERSIRVALESCDFNTGAIAYGVRDEKVYDDGAIEGIMRGVIDLHYGGDDPHVMMARLVMHSNTMSFTIGPIGIEYIRHRYKPETTAEFDRRIEMYLVQKGKQARTTEVLDRLKEIACH